MKIKKQSYPNLWDWIDIKVSIFQSMLGWNGRESTSVPNKSAKVVRKWQAPIPHSTAIYLAICLIGTVYVNTLWTLKKFWEFFEPNEEFSFHVGTYTCFSWLWIKFDSWYIIWLYDAVQLDSSSIKYNFTQV